MVEQMVHVGMIGLGSISYSHEAGYSELGETCKIIALCDIHEEEVNNRIGMHEGAKGYARYLDLLDNPDVDMVDITVPHVLHYEIAKAALEKGKHVLVEKPITVRSDQAEELIALAKQNGLKFSVAENTHFVTAYLRAEQILKQNILGDIWSVRTLIAGSEAYRIKDPNLWHGKAPYGGVILDSSVHNFYLFKWLFGGVRDVLGFASKIIPEGEMEDNGLILGHLANGAEFQLNTSCTFEIPWTERVEIYGSQGGMIIDQLSNPVIKYYLGSNDIDGTVVDGVPFDPMAWKFNSMIAEVGDFVHAVIEDRPPRIDPADALYALKAAEAVARSIETRQAVFL
ncbi:MAG: Gfo/Idh/MocA family oxidoreductase [Anaerolineales bacterium]|jgi:predicted dehydrogenase